jgi:hypothetical protein
MSRNHVDEALGGAHAETPEEKLLKAIFPNDQERARVFAPKKVDPVVKLAMSIGELKTNPGFRALALFARSLGLNPAQRCAAFAALLIAEADSEEGGFFGQLCAEKALEDISEVNGSKTGEPKEKFLLGSVARLFKGNPNINLQITPR